MAPFPSFGRLFGSIMSPFLAPTPPICLTYQERRLCERLLVPGKQVMDIRFRRNLKDVEIVELTDLLHTFCLSSNSPQPGIPFFGV